MASGDTLLVFQAAQGEPTDSYPATYGTRGSDSHPVMLFDAGANNESIMFTSIMPRNYGGGGVTVYIHYSMTSATGNEIIWQVAFERIGDQQLDIDNAGFETANVSAATTVPSTSGYVDVIAITFTDGVDMDSVAVGELFRIKITRNSASVDDDAAGDAELHAIEIKET